MPGDKLSAMIRGPAKRWILTVFLILLFFLLLYILTPRLLEPSENERLHKASERMFPGNGSEIRWFNNLISELSNSTLKYISLYAFRGCVSPQSPSFFLKLDTYNCVLFCIGRDLKFVGFYHVNNTCTCWNTSETFKSVKCSADSVLFFEQRYIQGSEIKNRLNSNYRGCTLLGNVPDMSLQIENWQPKPLNGCITYCGEKSFPVAVVYKSSVCFCSKYLSVTRQSYPDTKCDHSSSKLDLKTFVRVYITTAAVDACQDAVFAPEGTFPMLGLVSPQGSGTTWTRFSIEQMTGYISGSIYNGPVDKALGLRGEGEPWDTGRSPVVKSHTVEGKWSQVFDQSEKLLTVIRNPMRAALSERNRRILKDVDFLSSKKMQAPLEDFTSDDFMTFSDEYITNFWKLKIQKILKPKKNVMILSYEDMQDDLLSQLLRILRFLGLETDETLNRAFCTVERQPIEARTRKRNATIDYYQYANFNLTVVVEAHKTISELLLQKGLHVLRPVF